MNWLRRLLTPQGPTKHGGRLPVLIWGDAFPAGGRPQVRRALAGVEAHECMYSWVYLTELLAVREMLKLPVPNGSPMERFATLKSLVSDPNNQLSSELPEVFLPVANLLKDGGEFVELGSTFFASVEKLDLAMRLLGNTMSDVTFSGIEYSPFMHQAARSLHPDMQIQLVHSPEQWRRSRERAVHVSRFVASYAFSSTAAFAAELERFDAFHIIDAFALDGEFRSWDLGLPITFLDVEQLAKKLTSFDLYVGKATPEYHWTLRKKAMVLRLFGVKKGLADHNEPRFKSGLGKVVDESLTADQWAEFAEQKRHFPIWSGPAAIDRKALSPKMDLSFSSGELAEAVSRAKWLK